MLSRGTLSFRRRALLILISMAHPIGYDPPLLIWRQSRGVALMDGW
jgi:hypothetical protein